ncbi:MAG TPA: flagellar basal body M-ring protein FliF [Hydrogenophaga sp.]|jgi:flagellar M-ring protein FliF|uniref:flagellar basal-body MS-ring/collar protein FliF n=1 Tax=Hydrogenophaga TaxID=47420 RepID=UPI0008D5CB8A|nr:MULTISPECIES: flagellar basal-body MS-ring/collar protein FliF [Hydrogenophaga]MBU4180334.1 flagellar M-ring protein FliF [Gammaproteobacteria bacterium]OGA75094.1 MAG: flagellar M-ring protein FliF [Burkholderiales bacterium GWE1_65_30]OGA90867.1 MAG: flagellar M-ring protein FliF [Burkholderiales bacterium GWF1_66_17]PKO75495.1 MAG: flagellar basal body M-ring protein FliF [Betaproteobacteria bacterium HGW-Betaproteobacteria-15]MBU4280664.1 flagellar M-ring protein FliF [Gammaproteobacter
MSNTVAELDIRPMSRSALGEGLSRMDRTQKTRLGLGALALVAIALALFFMGQQPDWRVLYTNLGDKDGGAIVAQLTQMNVPYKHSEGGGSIMVPADKVHDTRLRLASLGLPKGTVNGFELMEANRFGMTQFQERLTFQRGLEGELTRSIQSLSSVQTARIHLALPNQNGFFREQQKPSASVLLTLHPGRTLDKAQVAGIVHLVASSVPEMNPKAVSIVDDAGNLLSSTPEGQSQGADTQKLQYTQQIEQMYTRRILDMIEPLVGEGNVKAQVSADVDFSLVESTSELHKPNQSTEAGAVRSQQIVEDGSPAAALPAGVPGATTNQPPTTGTAPINGEAAALGAAGAADKAASTRRQSLINYEVDKTVKVVREASGTVRRLSAAVVVNHRSSTDKGGKETTAAIPPEQLEQMTALVRETIGFNKERGDSVNVVNAVFNVSKAPEEVAVAWWRQPENMELARGLAWPLGMVGMGLLVLLGMVRPGLKLMKAPALPPAEAKLNAMVNDQPERPGLPMPSNTSNEATPETRRLTDAKRLALENPMAVANIVKGWVNGEAPA